MPWREVSVMEERREFIRLAMQEGANRRELCRRFGISPAVGYKWLGRWLSGEAELANRSRRPQTSPCRSSAEIEAQVLRVRDVHPAWGARKIVRCLEREGLNPPAASLRVFPVRLFFTRCIRQTGTFSFRSAHRSG